jgi:hypothetical protein
MSKAVKQLFVEMHYACGFSALPSSEAARETDFAKRLRLGVGVLRFPVSPAEERRFFHKSFTSLLRLPPVIPVAWTVWTRKQVRSTALKQGELIMKLTKRIPLVVAALAASALLVYATGNGRQAFGFNSQTISGFPGGRSAELTGGGAFDLGSGFVHAAGGFRCLSDINGGPLNGCLAGQGVRWDTSSLLQSSVFTCTGAAVEPVKTAFTNDSTVVLLADFYRQGDGNNESFTAKMIVSQSDLDPVAPGIQNVWIQGVGCGEAVVNFNH